MSFFNELKRRNVFRVGVAYIIAAWVFLQVADLVLDAINAPDWVLQALLMLSVLGFIAAVIVAWAYEVTPEGIKRESEVDRSESITQETAARLNRLTIGLVVAGIAVVAVDRLLPEKGSKPVSQPISGSEVVESNKQTSFAPDESPAERSVAVLPFVNMSSDPEQEFFSDGISEEILNVLVKIPNLKVAARTSSFQFKGQNLDIADIARQLKVNHILEGSVRKSGDQIRITAQLIEAESGYHLWSDTFDRKLEDVFAIQDEIAGAIAGELRTRLADEPLAGSQQVNMEAFELYLKGRTMVASRDRVALLKGIEILKSAVRLAPGYAPAMANLAKAHMVLPWFDRSVEAGMLREQAREWATRALEIDPDNPDALSTLAVVTSESDMDPEKAIELMRFALEKNPGSAAVHNFLGDILMRTGDLESALIHETKAIELDPLAPIHLTDLANIHLIRGDLKAAGKLARQALELDPNFGHALRQIYEIWFHEGDLDSMKRELERLRQNQIFIARNDLVLMVFLLEGDLEAARSFLAGNLDAARAGDFSPVNAAFQALLLADFDAAGEMLLLALDRKDGTWTYPDWVRLPEQAPDSEPWQEFWRQPGPARFAELRRGHGMSARVITLKERGSR